VTPAERLRQHQRSLAKAQRELDRERTKLEQSEKKLIMDIKKSAKAGQLVRALPIYSPFWLFLLMDMRFSARRTLARSWLRTWFAHADMSKSSTRCARNCRLSDCAFRRYEVISKWPTPCAVPLVFALFLSLPTLL